MCCACTNFRGSHASAEKSPEEPAGSNGPQGRRGTLPLDLRWSSIPAPCTRRIENEKRETIRDLVVELNLHPWISPTPAPARRLFAGRSRRPISQRDLSPTTRFGSARWAFGGAVRPWCLPSRSALLHRPTFDRPPRRSTGPSVPSCSPPPHTPVTSTPPSHTKGRQTARHQGLRRRWAHHRPRPQSPPALIAS